jgi:hypothetical protein
MAMIKAILSDTRGGAALVMALAMPIFAGGLGFGAEAGLWYFNQRKLQNAADVAAYAAATELRAGKAMTQLVSAAEQAATQTGFRAQRGTVATNWPPASGGFAADFDAVEVTVEERLPRLFTAIFGEGDVVLSGRAVARISGGVPTCVLALHPTVAGAVTFSGSTDTILVGCNVHSNSIAGGSAIVTGSADVQADCLSAAGTINVTANLSLTNCVAPYEHADVVPDPYAALAPPTVPVNCANSPNNNPQSVISVSPGCFNNLDFKGDVTLSPGVYVVKGDLTINAQARVRGDGVTIYFAGNGAARFNGGATIQLNAPNTGTYAGMLMFGERGQTGVDHRINGNSNSFFNGAIYAADSEVQMLGGGQSSGGCTQVVASMVLFSGNSAVGMDCTGWAVEDIRSSRLITLVE